MYTVYSMYNVLMYDVSTIRYTFDIYKLILRENVILLDISILVQQLYLYTNYQRIEEKKTADHEIPI